eukprot:GHVU01088351.1.p1 GENE.GHVU01088351.1~~GHVU01088351.1.p1  ORF type:complete len:162 (-),score=2.58 GHVU01088351.1:1176-1661(-)
MVRGGRRPSFTPITACHVLIAATRTTAQGNDTSLVLRTSEWRRDNGFENPGGDGRREISAAINQAYHLVAISFDIVATFRNRVATRFLPRSWPAVQPQTQNPNSLSIFQLDFIFSPISSELRMSSLSEPAHSICAIKCFSPIPSFRSSFAVDKINTSASVA